MADLTPEMMREMAAGIGLTRLAPEHVAQLLRATQAAAARRDVLRFDGLTPADEPAHVFSLPGDAAQ